jgi:hypothetical protein
MFSKPLVAVTITGVAMAFTIALSAMPLEASDRAFVVAQDKMNPRNDPDVQKGIDQRQEQERQSRIEACVRKAEANLTVAQRIEQDERIRRNCTSREPRVTSTRG